MPARVNEVGRQAVRVEAPDADAEVADGEAVLLVHLDAVGPGVAAGELDRDSGLGERAPAMSGRRQICCERVIATYTWVFVVLSVTPLGEGALSTMRCSSPLARRRYTRPLGSAIPVCPWSVK